MKLGITKKDGLFNLRPVYKWMTSQTDGVYNIEIKKSRKIRSLDQNGWLWGCIYPLMLKGLNDAGWEFTSTEQVHEYFKQMLASEEIINKHSGEIIEIPGSTAIMDTVEFGTYCEALRSYALEYLNIEIPDPNRYEGDIQSGIEFSD